MLNLDPEEPEALWFIAQGEDEGKPLIFRVRQERPEGISTDKYQHLLIVSWNYEPWNETGMPAQDQVTEMQFLENLLRAALEGPKQSFLTVVVTGNGVRELQWYSRDRAETMALVNKALSNHDPFPIQFIFQEDKAWEAYERFRAIRDS